MRFSLILATVGRIEEPKHFLVSLKAQTYHDFELIVVDQNPDDRLKTILQPYINQFLILYMRTNRGISQARNMGLKQASGDVITFPDDDCWYSDNLLEQVAQFFNKHPEWHGLTARSVDIDGRSSVGRWDKNEGPINQFNEWTRSVEFSIFVRRVIIEKIGGFDEELGPGADTPWGAYEGDDFILRALQSGFHFYYNLEFLIYHPQPIQSYNTKALQRAQAYGQGMGRVLRKHKYPLWFVIYYWLRSLSGALLTLTTGNIGKAKYYWATLKGRVKGWRVS